MLHPPYGHVPHQVDEERLSLGGKLKEREAGQRGAPRACRKIDVAGVDARRGRLVEGVEERAYEWRVCRVEFGEQPQARLGRRRIAGLTESRLDGAATRQKAREYF